MPIIFPQFGAGPLPKHGFARDSEWAIGDRADGDGESVVTLSLRPTPEHRAVWPHDYHLDLTVSLGAALTMRIDVTNPGPDPFVFSGGFHGYFRVRDLAATRLEGLVGRRYRDQLRGWEESAESEPTLVVRQEIDRVYLGGPGTFVLREPHRTVTIESEGFGNVVVWNPGPAGDARFDFAPGEWKQFLCVEPAVVFDPVTVKPGETWRGMQRVTVAPGAAT